MLADIFRSLITFTFTGQGGRDLKGTPDDPKNLRTAPQSKDQELKTGNLALKISYENKTPVRVIRGFKLDSPYAPETGYSTALTYKNNKVKKFWQDTGLSGFKVYKYALLRIPGQPPIPRNDGKVDDAQLYAPVNEENEQDENDNEPLIKRLEKIKNRKADKQEDISNDEENDVTANGTSEEMDQSSNDENEEVGTPDEDMD
ncbi:hypothetical protein HK096_002480 [Nowakowskiella sp. JEL0078]|nr:hypothetical protein HK096_002480 [Nowakowskiella sp. JEL0078]